MNTMTNSPDRKVLHRDANELERLFVKHGFTKILSRCKSRIIVDEVFWPSKLTHPDTVREHGEIFSDESGIRAVVFHYTHSDGTIKRSIKRLLTDDADYQLSQPAAKY
jgi:hypothetical protein